MPVKIRRKGKCYSVRTPGGIKAKCTTRHKAKAQERLLNAIDKNPDFRPRGRRSRRA